MNDEKPSYDQWLDKQFEPLSTMPMERSIVADVSAQLPDRQGNVSTAASWPRYAILSVAVVLGVLGGLQLSVVELIALGLQSLQEVISLLPGREGLASTLAEAGFAEAGRLGGQYLLIALVAGAALLSPLGLSLLED